MKEFLEVNGAEVANMLFTEWDMDKALAISKEEGYEDGDEYGEQKNAARPRNSAGVLL